MKRILLIVGGGIAAYKSCELVRLLAKAGHQVTPVLTKGGEHFVAPMTLGALAKSSVYTSLWDLKDEVEMGHIELSRAADFRLVCPATADLLAKMAGGLADDLATTLLLATDKPVVVAPAMNVRMWLHPATQRNLNVLQADGVHVVGPNDGAMAEAEFGPGRMAEPLEVAAAVERLLAPSGLLAGKHVIVTSGPTHEPIDPVRYIANRSSGKQGHAIAKAAAEAGARVTLISGPVTLPDPSGVTIVHVESARAMLEAVEEALPADIGIFAAAVADWRVANAGEQKIKKKDGALPNLSLTENPDILATVSHRAQNRPPLMVGFAAETEHVIEHARQKLAKKGCDLIVANDVSTETGVMGGDSNSVHLVTGSDVETWPTLSKTDVAKKLVERLGAMVGGERP
jgi:phosphopantothenoylcysteine decarboxylase / phosphopantothenate---cysteine ligase